MTDDTTPAPATALPAKPLVETIPVHGIPSHIAGNLLEFLRRVECKGVEAIAWVEAYQHVQKHVPQQLGVPFGGLPPK